MKKLKEIFLCLGIVVLFTSCDLVGNKNKDEELSSIDFNKININDQYSVLLPKYLKKTNDLNEDASLQYQNLARETYIIIIDESKEEFINSFKETEIYIDSLTPLENYSEYLNGYLYDALNSTSYDSGFTDRTINKWPAKIKTVQGEYYELDFEIIYWLAFIETDEKMYYIMCWTLPDRRMKYEKTFEKVINSFKTM